MALLKSGNFIGTVGSKDTSRYQMHMDWEQHSISGNYTQTKVIAKMYFWSLYEWHSTVFADNSHITINGNLARPSADVGVSGSGERLVMTHEVIVSHSTATNISISGRCDIHKSYDTPYWYGVEGSSTISLAAPPAKPVPAAPTNVKPTSGNYESGQAVTISWGKSTISSGSVTYHRVFVNGVNIANVSGSTTSYVWNIPSADTVGTKYTASVDALSNLSVASSKTSATGSFYKIASTPTTPTNIKPNSGQYAYDIVLEWAPSTVNNSTVTKYNVYINNSLVGSTATSSLSWSVPDNDPTGTSYVVSIEAIGASGKTSSRGYATGAFYKAETNSAPNIPILSIQNPIIQNKYIAESTLDAQLSEVTDPDGDTVRYALYGEYLEPGSNEWVSLGDTNKCILWSTSYRNVSINVKKHIRGTQYRVWGCATDDKTSSSNTSTISNIYRNKEPNRISSISPNGHTFYDDSIEITWTDTLDPDEQTVKYKIELIKNSSNMGIVRNYSASTTFSYDVPSTDTIGTTYQFKITPNDGMTDGTSTISPIYVKGDSTPTKPTNIKPNSGFYKYSVNINWDNSKDPEGESVTYNVYINSSKINNSPILNNYTTWNIPNVDFYGKSYLIGVEAIDVSQESSGIEYATSPFYKADMLNKPINIFAQDVNVIEVLGEKKYFSSISLKYWYENSNISLLYNLQCALVDSLDNKTIEELLWEDIAIGTNLKEWNYDIKKYNDDSKIIFRVKAIDGYGDCTGWGYSNFCKVYSQKQEDNCTITYPVENSTVYTKRPYFCINCQNQISSNNWVCLTINNKVFDKLFLNEKGKLILKCPIDLTIGENEVKICQKNQANTSTTYSSIEHVIKIKHKECSLQFNKYAESEKFSNIFSMLKDFSTAYGIPSDFPYLTPGKTQISYFNTLGKMRKTINDVSNKINNLYDPIRNVCYSWKKYKIKNSIPIIIGFKNPKLISTSETAYEGISGYTDYYFDEERAFVLSGEYKTITGSIADTVTTIYKAVSSTNGINFQIAEISLKTSPTSLQENIRISPRLNSSYVYKLYTCDFVYGGSSDVVKEYVETVYSSSPDFYPSSGEQNQFYYEKIDTIYSWKKYKTYSEKIYKMNNLDFSNERIIKKADYEGRSSYNFDEKNGWTLSGKTTTLKTSTVAGTIFKAQENLKLIEISKKGNSEETLERTWSCYAEDSIPIKGEYIETVSSTNPSLYPIDGVGSDGYWYISNDTYSGNSSQRIKLEWKSSGPRTVIKKELLEEAVEKIKNF